jgi:transcriptional regulator with XRE-family HTH domain
VCIENLVCIIDNIAQIILFTAMTDMQIYQMLGRAVAKRRKELGMVQADVAERISLTRASLANIETGRQKILLHQVYRLAAALKLKTILDLIPPNYTFDQRSPKPLRFSGSEITPAERANLERLVELAFRRGRSAGRR